jgi:hypothetical protein
MQIKKFVEKNQLPVNQFRRSSRTGAAGQHGVPKPAGTMQE